MSKQYYLFEKIIDDNTIMFEEVAELIDRDSEIENLEIEIKELKEKKGK